MDGHILENASLRLRFSAHSGALIGLQARETGWELLNRPQVGLSFRLLVPLPHRRNTQVLGEEQDAPQIHAQDDHRQLNLIWPRVRAADGTELAIRVEMTVTLDDRQARFAVTVDNQSPYPVENVYAPYLGDIRPPVDAPWFKTFLYQYATAQEWPLWPIYQNLRGYYGVDHPTQFAAWSAGVGAPMSPFILLRSPDQGLYVGVDAPSSELVAWHTELRPGYADSLTWSGAFPHSAAHVPPDDTLAGHPVVTRFAAVHVPYIQPGERRVLTPIVLEAYRGDWQAGVDRYTAWRRTWMPLPSVPAWAAEPHAWQQLHINSPEGEYRLRFTDLPAIGAECARHGVKALQLVGWNDGGQDQGNPSHDPDPRLGAFAELQAAIAAIQALGVKVILFTKFTWADRATPRFRNELIHQAAKDPHGDYYHYAGYQYQTATQLLDINTKRLIPMCFLSEAYLHTCEDEFRKVVALGADGMLFDESLHHTPSLLCFDPTHGHRPGAPVYANDVELIRRLQRLVPPDFLMAGEACYDWEFAAYQLSYHRSDSHAHIPLSRYMLPTVPLMTAVTGFDDRNMINQCLLYRYLISYEPFNFKGRLDDIPQTVAYGRQMDVLRTQLRGYFWDGEFCHTVGAHVAGQDGSPHHPYAVFRRADGALGLVIANYHSTQSITVTVTTDGPLQGRYRLVDDPTWRAAAEGVLLPPRSAAVLIA